MKELFLNLLKIASFLPKADVFLQQKYNLSRKQVYLVFLVKNFPDENLSFYANYLNISNSTLTRNIEKLEHRKILQRQKMPGQKSKPIKLLSLGQLYYIDIEKYLYEYLAKMDAKPLRESISALQKEL